LAHLANNNNKNYYYYYDQNAGSALCSSLDILGAQRHFQGLRSPFDMKDYSAYSEHGESACLCKPMPILVITQTVSAWKDLNHCHLALLCSPYQQAALKHMGTQSNAYLQGVELTLELIILLLKVIYDGLILSNVLLHRPCILAHVGLDLLSSVSVLEGIHRVVVLHAGRCHCRNHGCA